MKIFLLGPALMMSFHVQAQEIRYCDTGKPDTTVCAKYIIGGIKFERKKIMYRNIIINNICSLDGAFIISFGNNELYRKAGFQLICEDILPGKPFNNKQNGFKSGIWFKTGIFGRVRAVYLYEEGHIREIITFWTTGLPKTYVKYNTTGRLIQGSSEYYSKRFQP